MDRAAADQARLAAAGTTQQQRRASRRGCRRQVRMSWSYGGCDARRGWFYEGGIYAMCGSTRPRRCTSRAGELCAARLRALPGGTSADQVSIRLNTEVINDSDVDVVGRVHAALVDDAGKTVATAVSEQATIEAATKPLPLHTIVCIRYLVAGVAQPVPCGDNGRGGRRDCRSGCADLWHSHRALRCEQGSSSTAAGEDQGTCNTRITRAWARPFRTAFRHTGWSGCNGWLERLPHLAQPPTPEFLDACDRMGMLCWTRRA